jgi:hypothetical protein
MPAKRGLSIWHVPCRVDRARAHLARPWRGGFPPPRMALPFGETPGARDARALAILARTIYRELRSSGFEARDVIALAGELLGQVTTDVKAERGGRK